MLLRSCIKIRRRRSDNRYCKRERESQLQTARPRQAAGYCRYCTPSTPESYTVQLLLGVIGLVEALLVDDGVNGDSGLASLPVTDDQLTLATANGHKRVYSLKKS